MDNIKDAFLFGLFWIESELQIELDFSKALPDIVQDIADKNLNIGQLLNQFIDIYAKWIKENDNLRTKQLEGSSANASSELIELIIQRDQYRRDLVEAIKKLR